MKGSKWQARRALELAQAFAQNKVIMLSRDDLQLLYGDDYETVHHYRTLKPGERINSETEEVMYSDEWLGDE